MDLVALQRVESSWTRDLTCVPCITWRSYHAPPGSHRVVFFFNMLSRFAVAVADKVCILKTMVFPVVGIADISVGP